MGPVGEFLDPRKLQYTPKLKHTPFGNPRGSPTMSFRTPDLNGMLVKVAKGVCSSSVC